jgi:hypothetical protein
MTAARMLSDASRIIEMAQDLQDRGLHIEAMGFALAAARLLQVVRALEPKSILKAAEGPSPGPYLP